MITRHAFLNGALCTYDDIGSGPTVLLIHGFPLNRALWRPQQADLVAAGYRVIAPDLRGFGESDETDGSCSIDLFADDMVALLEHLDVDQAVVVGMSMGGYLLFNLLERYPQRLTAAVFMVTRSVADDEATRQQRLQLAENCRKYGPQTVADRLHPVLFAPGTLETRPKLGEEVYSWMVTTGSRGLVAGLLAMRDRRDSTPRLNRITVPTLVIGAAEDQVCPLEHARMIANGISGSRFVVVEDAGHLANLEQPNQINHHLLDFLRQVQPTLLNDGSIGCTC